MLRKEKSGIVWFEFEQLQRYPHIRHAVFSRSLDLAHGTDKRLAFNAIGLGPETTPIYLDQVHGIELHLIEERLDRFLQGDGTLSKLDNVALCVQHADCQAALFYDPETEAVAAVHCGWRGSCKNIYRQTVEHLTKAFGSRPEDILVSISPSLGPDRAEFKHFERELPTEFLPFQVRPTYFDFWKISRWQLEQAGIASYHIEIASMCTYEQKELFFSYRRDHQTERMMSLIWKTS